MNLFNISLRLSSFPIGKATKVLNAIQKIPKSDYLNFIENKKQEILSFHLENNLFYNQLTKGVDVSAWGNLPVITKRDLQQPLKERLSKGFSIKNVYINKTSGSSGDPFIFAKDKLCHALTWAVIQDRFSWYDIDFNTSKQARFYGIPLDKKGYYKEKFKDFLSNRHRFSVFDLSDTKFDIHLEKFRFISFDYVNGYTSSIVQFAKYLKRKSTILKHICPSLKACFVTSEMLFEDDKELMQQQFGVPIINEYGASELDLIAFEHPSGKWLLNNETLFVEILDENNAPVPHGKEGRIVITSLFNKAHPFIRYDIGDIGIISEESSLKQLVLSKLTGRTNDIAFLPSGKKAAGLTFYYITKSIIEDDGNIKEFIIEQLQIDTFKILYASPNKISNEKIEKIKTAMDIYLEKGLHIIFERKEKLVRSKSGKLKQFKSYLKNNT